MRVRYEPNNVLMLPMPTEKFKLVVNILLERDLEADYDEAWEDERRKEAETTKKGKKFIPFRACRVKYCEVDYDFYGLCSAIYVKAAEEIGVTPDQIDLFVQVDEDNCASVASGSCSITCRRSTFFPTRLRAFSRNSPIPSRISCVPWFVMIHHSQP